jgi:hypothetical protein
MPPGVFQRMRLRVKAEENAERWAGHLTFPNATPEQAQQAHETMRAVYVKGFLAAAVEEVPVEQGMRVFLSKFHASLPPNAPEEQVRNADANLGGAYRMGYRAGMVAVSVGL